MRWRQRISASKPASWVSDKAGDRLENHLDFAALDGFAQVVLEAQELGTLSAHVLAEKLYRIPPPALGLIERDLGVLGEILRRSRIVDKAGDAIARGQKQLAVAQPDGPRQRAAQLLGEGNHVALGFLAVENNPELVARQAGERVFGSDQSRKAAAP